MSGLNGKEHMSILNPASAPVPETIEVGNCAVGKMELPNGAMALVFTIPGIKRYVFPLDVNGRRSVGNMCISSLDIPG